MNEKPENPAAFAACCADAGQSWMQEGMTLRDYFAAAALQGIIAGKEHFHPRQGQAYKENLAELAYIYADAMLKARA